MTTIHSTAVVDTKAELSDDVEVGPFCVIGPHVEIGAGSVLKSHVVVENHTTIGKNATIFPFASIGSVPQDLKFRGEPSRLIIGDNNTIRESVTMNLGTELGEMETRVGSDCLFMAYSHVAHDCVVGDGVILANGVALAGHVAIQDRVTLGGLVAVHQFCRIGRYAFLGGGAMVAQDVPPFCLVQGDRAQLVGVNAVGLKRAGFDRNAIRVLRTAFKRLFLSQETRMVALERVEKELAGESELVAEVCAFIRGSERGIAAPRQSAPTSDAQVDED